MLQSPGYGTPAALAGTGARISFIILVGRRETMLLALVAEGIQMEPSNRTSCSYRDKQHLSSTKHEFLGS